MDRTLHKLLRKDLCPDGIWQLTDIMKSMLKSQISRLPRASVSETEKRYPTTAMGMRAFLDVFFVRHYFQAQHSLFDYMTSNEFLALLTSGKVQILDVGCGPAVASIAITDMLACILEHLKNLGEWPKSKIVKLTYVLNDTSGICLGTGQRVLTDYFRMRGRHSRGIVHARTISIQKAFPDNMNQLKRVRLNLDPYDIVIFSYVISPLNENKGFDHLVSGLLNIEKLCNHSGRILILQDKFQETLVRQMGRAVGISAHKKALTQHIYSSSNMNETYTYSYYSCLYAPAWEKIVRVSCVA
jgi:SAM-dependent methyltransferase